MDQPQQGSPYFLECLQWHLLEEETPPECTVILIETTYGWVYQGSRAYGDTYYIMHGTYTDGLSRTCLPADKIASWAPWPTGGCRLAKEKEQTEVQWVNYR